MLRDQKLKDLDLTTFMKAKLEKENPFPLLFLGA